MLCLASGGPRWHCTPSVLVHTPAVGGLKGSEGTPDPIKLTTLSCRYCQINKDDQDNHCQEKLRPLHQEICQVSSSFSQHVQAFPVVHFVAILSKVLASASKAHAMQCSSAHPCLTYIWLLCRYEKRHTNVPVHVSPCFRVADGDTVIFGQCRWASTVP